MASEPVTTNLREECGSGNAEEQGRLPAVAARVAQHRCQMARLGRVEGLRSRQRRSLGYHEIRTGGDLRRKGGSLFVDNHVTSEAQRFTHRCHVVAERVAHEELDVQWPHRSKVQRGATLGDMLDFTQLSVGADVHHPLLLLDVVVRSGDHPRTILVLGNRTGKIESAPFWSGRDEMVRGLAKGMIVQVVGKVASYRESMQLEATSVRPLPKGSIALSELVPSVGPVDRYWHYLDETRAKISAPRLRAVLDLFYADDNFRLAYEQCPGSPGTGHHAALGGLLQHTTEVVRIGVAMARVAHADTELVAAAAMLHDIGKLRSYSWSTGVFDTTEEGRLIGHVVIGAMMLREALASAPTPLCTDDEALVLTHLILSHHGKLELGSPVRPLTLEAEILHYADDSSAKTASLGDAFASRELFPGGSRVSTRRVWQADNRFLVNIRPDFGRVGGGEIETADQQD